MSPLYGAYVVESMLYVFLSDDGVLLPSEYGLDFDIINLLCTGMYLCMYRHHLTSHVARTKINRVRLPILPWSAEQGKWIFPCPRSRLITWSRETGSAVPSRVSLLISTLRLNLVLTYEIPPEFRGGVHLII